MVNEKNILIVGRTGGGESPLADLLKGNSEGWKTISLLEFADNNSSNLTDQEIALNIIKVCDNIKDELTQILFVFSKRLTKSEAKIYKTIKDRIFDDDGVTEYTTIVRTGFHDFENQQECKKDIEELKKYDSKNVAELIRSITSHEKKKFVHIFIPSLEEMHDSREIEQYKEIRKISREILLEHLESCKEMNYRPKHRLSLISEIFKYKSDDELGEILEAKRKEIKNEEGVTKTIHQLRKKVMNKSEKNMEEIENSLLRATIEIWDFCKELGIREELGKKSITYNSALYKQLEAKGQKSEKLRKRLEDDEEKLEENLTKKEQKITNLKTQITDKQKEIKSPLLSKEELTNPQWQITTEKPTLERTIGEGGYGKVYYGKWKLQEVAVKKLFLLLHNTPSESDIKNVKKEIDILKNLRNRYIIQYYGIYSDDRDFLIIMDYAENGTLTKFINDNKDQEHDWSFNNSLIKQMVLGLAYIHQENVIHRDLKSMNILLTNNYQVKISDFGLSRTKIISSSQSKHGAVGTLRWIAPEVIKEQKYSEQSDIYALGMVMWEIVAKCTTPFKDLDNNLVMFKIFSNGKEIIPSDTPKNIQNIIQQCWKDIPNERTTLANILEIIGNAKLSPQVVHTSRLLPQNSKEINEQSLSYNLESLKIDEEEMDDMVEQQLAQQEVPPKGNN